jgi:hypothetical protein
MCGVVPIQAIFSTQCHSDESQSDKEESAVSRSVLSVVNVFRGCKRKQDTPKSMSDPPTPNE